MATVCRKNLERSELPEGESLVAGMSINYFDTDIIRRVWGAELQAFRATLDGDAICV
jgi:hypothetical protein